MAEYDVENFISKILNSDEETWTPQEKMPLILEEIEKLKADTRVFIENSDFDVAGILDGSIELYAESKALIEEMEECKKEIEQETMAEILKSIESHDQITKELESVNFAMNIVCDVITCGRYVKDFDEGRQAQSFSKAVESVYDLLQFIEKPADGFCDMELYANIRNTAQVIMDSLIHDLNQEWDRMVSYSSKPGNRKSVVNFNISLDDSHISIDVVNALDKSTKLMEKITDFSEFLKKEVLIPMIKNDCVVYADSEESASVTLTHKANYMPSYSETLANMRLLFHYLNNRFNVPFHNERSLMKMFGHIVGEELCEMLIKDCLIDTIPYNINDLQTYGRVTAEIEDFQRFLIVTNIFPDKDLSLLKYMKNIDVLFAERSSQHFLETARSIMLKDLSLTMSIGVENIPEEPLSSESVPKDNNLLEALEIFSLMIPKSLFYFPRCMISKTAQELLDLVYIVMEQAVQCSDIVCKKLYDTVRLIFELYDAVVPYHHENYLQTIPQYVALFHNNCMYLAHNLQTLGHKWVSLMEGREIPHVICFVDLVQKMRDLGYKHLTMHMQQQRKQILDNIRSSANCEWFGILVALCVEKCVLFHAALCFDITKSFSHTAPVPRLASTMFFDLNCIVVKDVLSENAEAAVRQCLRQLQLLKNVWIGVFPPNVFVRLMATLVNMFLDELIHRVCTVEDISMEMATQLTEMYTLVVKKTPQLFQDINDVTKYVKSWIKLQELIFILGGSLKDIENHWNDGTGPLAVHFQVEELRSLIKALFQNTQFRANLLSKIK